MTSRRLLAAGLAVVGLVLAACGGSDDVVEGLSAMSSGEIDAVEDRMRALPSIEATEAHVTEAIERMSAAASMVDPSLSWEWARERNEGTCPGEGAGTRGISVFTASRFSAVPISDTSWPAVLDAVRTIAESMGLHDITIRVDQPGRHDVHLHSPDGRTITVGTYKAASISAGTGCRLRASDLAGAP